MKSVALMLNIKSTRESSASELVFQALIDGLLGAGCEIFV
jgi:hypothetical protein